MKNHTIIVGTYVYQTISHKEYTRGNYVQYMWYM